MRVQTKVPDKGDPSDILQYFPNHTLQLHCCRYWWLQHWEFRELSYPYWRIYYNNSPGAVIINKDKKYELDPDRILMIAPNTSYSSRLFDNPIPDHGYALTGGRINSMNTGFETGDKHCIHHLFMHFTLGIPYDNVTSGIYTFRLTEHLREKLIIIKNHLTTEYTTFSFYTNLVIQSLILDLLSEMPAMSWDIVTPDQRILTVLNYIEENVFDDLRNSELAVMSNMATNSFARLFTEETGISPQRYVKRKRIEKACVLLHHTNFSIDEVAVKTGFADRYHFSRIFKQITTVTPASYRKEFGSLSIQKG